MTEAALENDCQRQPAPWSADRTTGWRDGPAVLAIVALAGLTRAAWLDWPVFNPDESIYAARASFLLGQQTNAFSRPIGVEHTIEVYRWLGTVFGPYCLGEVRLVVSLICVAIALGIYMGLRPTAGRAAALLGAIVFLYGNLYFEGMSANREWFALAGLMGGTVVALAAGRSSGVSRLMLYGLAGFATGTALWFKQQAAPLVLPVLATPWLVEPMPPRGGHHAAARWRALGAVVVGGVLAAAGYALPFVLAGSLRDHLHFLCDFRLRYVFHPQPGAAAAQSAELGPWQTAWLLLYQALPGRRLFLLAYGAGAWLLVDAARCVFGSRLRPRATVPLFFAIYLPAALLAVRMGGRYFAHYFLFVVPALAVLVGWASGRLIALRRRPSVALWVWGMLAVALLVDALFVRHVEPVEQFLYDQGPEARRLVQAWASALPSFGTMWFAAAAALLAVGAIVWWGRERPRWQRVWLSVFALVIGCVLALDAGWLVAKAHLYPQAVVRAIDERGRCAEALDYLAAEATPADRLLVWGFYPEIYAYSGIEAASQLVTAVLVLGDVRGLAAGPPQIDAYYSDLLMEDLRQHPPRFVLDAAQASIHPKFYALKNYPPLARFLAAHYRYAGTWDDIRVYVLCHANSDGDVDDDAEPQETVETAQ